ncbi:MAG: hypothetical protein IH597_15110 [Bacteroidales bacterium]|nr:hypothetical protein [Bacteroidales bacterium]
MKFWSIAFGALAIAAFIAGLLGYHLQFIVFIIAGCLSYLFYLSHLDEQKFNL